MAITTTLRKLSGPELEMISGYGPPPPHPWIEADVLAALLNGAGPYTQGPNLAGGLLGGGVITTPTPGGMPH